MTDQKIMRDLGLNDPVTITAPAHTWLAAMIGYAEAEWNNSAMNTLLTNVQEALFDPIWLNEQLAQRQLQMDTAQNTMEAMMKGHWPPQPPPSTEELG